MQLICAHTNEFNTFLGLIIISQERHYCKPYIQQRMKAKKKENMHTDLDTQNNLAGRCIQIKMQRWKKRNLSV